MHLQGAGPARTYQRQRGAGAQDIRLIFRTSSVVLSTEADSLAVMP